MPVADLDEPANRFRGGRLLLVGGLLLAIGAAGTLVLSNDLRWLRLGIIAALWAALAGAFIAARYRGRAGDRDDRVADMQSMYELELEREIAARREYEARLEVDIRNQVEEQARQDVSALRDELRALRTTLETLLGGEVLVERYALQAQATRMRALDDGRLRAVPLKRITAGTNGTDGLPPEAITQAIDMVRDELPRRAEPSRPQPAQPSRPLPRPAQPLPRAGQPQASQPLPQVSQPLPQPARPLPQPSQPNLRPIERPKVVPPPRAREPQRGTPPPADTELTRVNGQPPVNRQPPANRQHPRTDATRPAWEERLFAAEQRPAERSGRWEQPAVEQRPAERSGRWEQPAVEQRPAERSGRWGQPAVEQRPAERSGRWGQPAVEQRPAERSGRWDQPGPPQRPADPYRQPSGSFPPIEQPGSTGRRHRTEPPDPPPARRHAKAESPREPGGHRRAEDAPAWQDVASWRPNAEPGAGEPGRETGSDRSGSHATGQSVADLLATHGTDSPRRRRRRAD